ncbi:MAG: hypothetical protein LBJ18_01130 [Rickettsiales bacterium]|jgi:hypothetical protein|nr:hypothetical protein [Rickettsiales bacterium]
MIKTKDIIINRFTGLFAFCLLPFAFCDANAYEYNNGRFAAKLTGSGAVGAFNAKSKDADVIGDWRIRGQANYAVASGMSLGAVYSIDDLATWQGYYARDAFLFFEDKEYGRIEIGMTADIASKLGVGLPDVGSLRINDYPIFYKEIQPNGAVISNTTATSGKYDLRASIATIPTNDWQFGASVAPVSDHFKYAADFGAKWRHPDGKTKTALSLGGGFISAPENFVADIYAPRLTADWRAQASAGLNLQYNSWLFGLTGRAIYDQNAIGVASDGIVGGIGASYDLLKYSVSASYLISDTGIWESAAPDYIAHTGLLSFRYKYSENVGMWISGGITTGTPFIGAGLAGKF